MNDIESDIRSFIQNLTERHLDVSGLETTGKMRMYEVNGHTLTEEEIDFLGHIDRLTTWDVYSYVKSRARAIASSYFTWLKEWPVPVE